MPREKVAQALEGNYRPEHLFTLKQSLDSYRYYQKLIADLDHEIRRLMQVIPSGDGRTSHALCAVPKDSSANFSAVSAPGWEPPKRSPQPPTKLPEFCTTC